MGYIGLATRIAQTVGSLATLGSVLSATSLIRESGLPEYTKAQFTPQSTADMIKAAETQAVYSQKITGLDNPQNSGIIGLPAKTGTDPLDSKVAAALAALGIGGAAAATAIGVRRVRAGRRVGRRRRRYGRRFSFRRPKRYGRRRYGVFRRRGRGYARPRYGRRWGGRRF